MTSVYLEIIRTLYTDSSKLRFLLMSGMLPEYFECASIISKFYDMYEKRDIEGLISKLSKLDHIRVFIVRYLSTYLSYKGESLATIEGLTSAVNSYVSTIITQLNSAVDFYILKARSEKAQFLAIQRIFLHIGELLEFYKSILLKDPEDALDFIRLKYEHLEHLVTKQASVAKKIKELNESVFEEEIPIEESEEETKENPKSDKDKREQLIKLKAQQPHEAISLSKKVQQKYVETLMKNEELRSVSSKLSLFNKAELNLLFALLRREAICPNMATLETISEAISVTPDTAMRIVRQINAKVRDRFGTFLIDIDDSEQSVLLCIHRIAMDSIKGQLAQYHPNLVAMYEDVITKIDKKK